MLTVLLLQSQSPSVTYCAFGRVRFSRSASWTASHVSILALAREVERDTDDLIALCSERLTSFDDLYLEKMEEFHSDLNQVEEWLEEIGAVLKLEPAEEVEMKGTGSSGSSEKYDIDQLINLLKVKRVTVCTNVCVYIYMHNTHTHTQTHKHTYTHTYTQTHIHTYTHTDMGEGGNQGRVTKLIIFIVI